MIDLYKNWTLRRLHEWKIFTDDRSIYQSYQCVACKEVTLHPFQGNIVYFPNPINVGFCPGPTK